MADYFEDVVREYKRSKLQRLPRIVCDRTDILALKIVKPSIYFQQINQVICTIMTHNFTNQWVNYVIQCN